MSSQDDININLVLLAGSTEAGKSSAGVALASFGALRLKIREILLRLSTGIEVVSVGAKTRVGFDKQEFLEVLTARRAELANVTVIESLIDPMMAEWLKSAWRHGKCCVVFIDAPFEIRVARLACAAQIGFREARQIVGDKDSAKGLPGTLGAWRKLADEWICNDASLDRFLAQMHYIYCTLARQDTTERGANL